MRRLFRQTYLHRRLILFSAGVTVVFVLGYLWPVFLVLGKIGLGFLVAGCLIDLLALYRSGSVVAERDCPERFSNGDENIVTLRIENNYGFESWLEIIDEMPEQFQVRDQVFDRKMPANSKHTIRYGLRPVQRGIYNFGGLNVLVSSPIKLLRRRMTFAENQDVAVYPSFIQMREYELYAVSNRLQELGIKKQRRIGHTMEFDQIRSYVQGDDIRTINWKATARRNSLMVNQYQDERSQPVYCLIDKGRMMKMPFEGMTLLDYAINASLVMANIAMLKHDRAGLITFAAEIDTVVPAERKPRHIYTMMEALYHQKTNFNEPDYGKLHLTLKKSVKQRSLMLLFSNFTSLSSLRRQLPYLRSIARDHVLVVIFFVNTELNERLTERPKSVEDVYIKAIGERFTYEKKEMAGELARYGIQAILTEPENLTVNTLNKYLELKARGTI